MPKSFKDAMTNASEPTASPRLAEPLAQLEIGHPSKSRPRPGRVVHQSVVHQGVLRSPFAHLRFACLALLGVGTVLAACTLTSDDYEPKLLAVQRQLQPDSGVAAPVPPACADAAQCCAALPCPTDQICVAGTCGPGSGAAGAPACTGTDCSMPEPLPLAASCEDKLRNQDETDTDCGGSCAQSCAVGQRCAGDTDCAQGAFCSPESARCESVSCSDNVRNGSEILADCGGGECAGCPNGTVCREPVDCLSGVCGADNRCAAPSCDDGVKNQNELDVDCGGVCRGSCEAGRVCAGGTDCQSGVCLPRGCAQGIASCCQAPSCTDGVTNGDEPVVDCGNLACGRCDVGRLCTANVQCQSGLCQFGRCATPATCNDNVRNGTETGIDCGGDRCPRCRDLLTCSVAADCVNNNCDQRGICISCGDAVQDGTETGVDCGGSDPFCRRCLPGEACQSNTDCQNMFCLGGVCT
jgi:hypothetical protein